MNWQPSFGLPLSELEYGYKGGHRREEMLNVIRHQAKLPLRRSYATAFVPPAALENVEFDRRSRGPPPKIKPVSPTFYTGRASYYDQLTSLESAISHTRSVLQNLQLLPLPKFAREALPPLQPVWKAKDSMGTVLEARLTTSRYRRVTTLLNQLNDYRRISETAGCYELAAHVGNVLAIFERENKEAVLARGKRKPVEFDEYGRSYTIGRRKESTARVWMIPVQEAPATPQAQESVQKFEPAATITEVADSAQDLTPSGPVSFVDPAQPVNVTSTNIIINNAPLSQYL